MSTPSQPRGRFPGYKVTSRPSPLVGSSWIRGGGYGDYPILSIRKQPLLSGSPHCGLFCICSHSYQIRAKLLSGGSQESQRRAGEPWSPSTWKVLWQTLSLSQARLPICHIFEPFYSWAPGHLEWRGLFEVWWSMELSSGWWNTSKTITWQPLGAFSLRQLKDAICTLSSS